MQVQGPLYPRNHTEIGDCTALGIVTCNLHYNTTVPDAMEICLVIVQHILISIV